MSASHLARKAQPLRYSWARSHRVVRHTKLANQFESGPGCAGRSRSAASALSVGAPPAVRCRLAFARATLLQLMTMPIASYRALCSNQGMVWSREQGARLLLRNTMPRRLAPSPALCRARTLACWRVVIQGVADDKWRVRGRAACEQASGLLSACPLHFRLFVSRLEQLLWRPHIATPVQAQTPATATGAPPPQPEPWRAVLSQVASWAAVMLATAVLTASAAFANAAQLTISNAAQRTFPQQVEAAVRSAVDQIALLPAWLLSLFGKHSEKARLFLLQRTPVWFHQPGAAASRHA